MDETRVSDFYDLESFTTSQLINSLKMDFRPAYFDKVEHILVSREQKLIFEKEEEGLISKGMMEHTLNLEQELTVCKSKFSDQSLKLSKLELTKIDLEVEVKLYKAMEQKLREKCTRLEQECKIVSEGEMRFLVEGMMQRTIDLEEELRVCNNKYSDASLKIGKLELTRIDIEVDLKRYKAAEEKLREKGNRLEKEFKIVSERESKAMRLTTSLQEELAKMHKGKEEEIVKVNTEIRDLKCMKRRAEDDIEAQRKRYKELETRVISVVKGFSDLISLELQVVEKSDLELEIGNDVSYQKGKNDESNQSENHGGANDVCSAELEINQKAFSCDENVCDSVGVGSICHSSI